MWKKSQRPPRCWSPRCSPWIKVANCADIEGHSLPRSPRATTKEALFFVFAFLGSHPWHMEVPKPGVESELQVPAYTTATAMWDLSCVFDSYHSSWQLGILSPLSKARDQTHILMYTIRVRFHRAMTGTPRKHLLSGECRCGTSTGGSEVHGVKCVFIRDCYTYHL